VLKRLLQRLPIRSGEGFVTSLMFCYIFGVLTFYYILKPLRSGLFLKNFPSSYLPYAYFMTAFFAGTLATLIFKLHRRISAIKLLTATNLGIIATLLFFRWAMGRDIFVLPYIYFVYVQIISVLSTAQFWLLAGYIYDHRQSKRIFPFLGAGAIAGAMAGSFIPGFLSDNLSTKSMLLICITVCAVLIAISQVAWRHRRPEGERPDLRKLEEPSARIADLLRLAFGSRHLFLIALLTFLTLIASQISEWQVNDAAQDAYSNLPKDEQEKEINELFGRFYFITNILGIILQLTLTGAIVRYFGIGLAILLLPMGLFFSAMGVFAVPALWTTVVGLGSNSVFRYSINRVGLELLYMPLSPEVRKRIKVFIDVFIDRLGRAIAGVIILGIAYTTIGLRGTAAAIILLAGACIAVALWLKKSYVEAFRQKLARREVDLTEISRYVNDPASVRLLTTALDSPHERQILYALQLLQSIRGVDFSDRLRPLLDSPMAYVREEAARTLSALPADYRPDAERLLGDPVERVRMAAVEYLCSARWPDAAARLERLLSDDKLEVRLAAANWLSSGTTLTYPVTKDLVQDFMSIEVPGASRARKAAVSLTTRLPSAEALPVIRAGLQDPDPEVVAAAALAAGKAGQVDVVFDILHLLSSAKMRTGAREALAAYGSKITGTLGDILGDSQHDPVVRRQIPWVLARTPTQRSADILVDNLNTDDPLLKYQIVKALNRLHETNSKLPEPRPAIAERIYAETRSYYEALLVYQALSAETNGSSRLMIRSLKERLDQDLEIIFRLLGLQYPQKDIHSAYAALKGNRADRRTSAIEFLDNLLQKNLKSSILPLLEEGSTDRLIDRASRMFKLRTPTREEALRSLVEHKDAWLKVCALHEIGVKKLVKFRDACMFLAADRDPLIQETARWALARLGG
jgi:AAA family ATP:ADP antiporter